MNLKVHISAEGGLAIEGFSWKQSVDALGHPIHEIQMGPFAKKMGRTLKKIAVTLAEIGHYIIIDDVAFGNSDVSLWKEMLLNYNVLWVGLEAPLEILEEREKLRNNRIQGSARAQYYKVHENVAYDLKFDTSKQPLQDIVEAIRKRLRLFHHIE